MLSVTKPCEWSICLCMLLSSVNFKKRKREITQPPSYQSNTASRLTRYLQTKSLTNTASRTLPTSLKILKGSNSSESDPPSCAGFSLASWPRSFIASSKRDRYFWRPGRGEPLRSSVTRSPLGLFRMPPISSSSEPQWGSQKPGRGEALFSGVALWERLTWAVWGLREDDDDDNGSVLSRSRWKWGSVWRWKAPAADMRRHQSHQIEAALKHSRKIINDDNSKCVFWAWMSRLRKLKTLPGKYGHFTDVYFWILHTEVNIEENTAWSTNQTAECFQSEAPPTAPSKIILQQTCTIHLCIRRTDSSQPDGPIHQNADSQSQWVLLLNNVFVFKLTKINVFMIVFPSSGSAAVHPTHSNVLISNSSVLLVHIPYVFYTLQCLSKCFVIHFVIHLSVCLSL